MSSRRIGPLFDGKLLHGCVGQGPFGWTLETAGEGVCFRRVPAEIGRQFRSAKLVADGGSGDLLDAKRGGLARAWLDE